MDFELPLEHQIAYESAFAFARDEIRPHNEEIERTDDFPPWIWKRLAEQGHTGIAIPEEYERTAGHSRWAPLFAPPLGRPKSAIPLSFTPPLNPSAPTSIVQCTEQQRHK